MIARPFFLALLALIGAGRAHAQDLAIVNAHIITMGPKGDIALGAVIVRSGRIVALGERIAVPPELERIDAGGQFVTPGLMMTMTTLGLKDVLKGPMKGPTYPGLSAAFELSADINPRHPQIGEAREEGVTHALVIPMAGEEPQLFQGQGALVALGQQGGTIVNPRAAMLVDATDGGVQGNGGSVGALLVRLRRALADARLYQRDSDAFVARRLDDNGLSRSDLAALGDVVTRREPLLIQVDRKGAIDAILAFAREERVRIILAGAAEGWMAADAIARAGVPVVVNGEANQASDFGQLNASYRNPALLARAGVPIAFQPPIFALRTPRFVAGRAARFGLPLHDALGHRPINRIPKRTEA